MNVVYSKVAKVTSQFPSKNPRTLGMVRVIYSHFYSEMRIDVLNDTCLGFITLS